jgi:hypothetical protein
VVASGLRVSETRIINSAGFAIWVAIRSIRFSKKKTHTCHNKSQHELTSWIYNLPNQRFAIPFWKKIVNHRFRRNSENSNRYPVKIWMKFEKIWTKFLQTVKEGHRHGEGASGGSVECTGSMEGSNYVVVAARGVDGSTDVADSVTARRRASRSSHGGGIEAHPWEDCP